MMFVEYNIHMKKLLLVLTPLLIWLSLFSGCKREKMLNIQLDNSDPLALAVDIEWAVVSDPYITFREEKAWTSKELGHGKKGDVLMVKGYAFSSENEKWVRFEDGFLPLKSVKIFSNKFQAMAASKEISGK